MAPTPQPSQPPFKILVESLAAEPLLHPITQRLLYQDQIPSHTLYFIMLIFVVIGVFFVLLFFFEGATTSPNIEPHLNGQSVFEPETESPSQVCFAGE